MKLRLPILLFALGLRLSNTLAFAGVEQISEKEFRDLAQELSAKVNLFQAGWEKDPRAEFYGGTTRDYLYWLKGQFAEAHNPKEAKAVVEKLKAQPIIDVRDFIIGDSDVDVISKSSSTLDAKQFGVRKIDSQSPDILDHSTEAGKNEILQGYIPAEKIRLAKDGFHATTLGDGVHEIYEGKLSIHFASAEDFSKSKYAQEGINHPILLAIRYLRLQAINYYRSHGRGFPDLTKLHLGMDEASAKAVKEVIAKALDSGELEPYLKRNKFKSWINGGIQKAFRSYTNPTAALELMKEFGVTQLPGRYPNEIETLNQYVFTKYRDQAAINAALKGAGTTESTLYSPLPQYFPDGRLYHGTKTEPAFRGILFQGTLPSEQGVGGPGLYGVAVGNKEFSERWGGDKDRLLSFALDPDSKLIDVTKGEGYRLWEGFKKYNGNKEDAFAEHYGADLLRYPYHTEAFVVKNGGILSDGRGVYRTVMSLGALIKEAKKTHSVQRMLDLLSVNQVTEAEQALIWRSTPLKVADLLTYAREEAQKINGRNPDLSPSLISALAQPDWRGSDEMGTLLAEWMNAGDLSSPKYGLRAGAIEIMNHDITPSPTRLALLDQLFADNLVDSAKDKVGLDSDLYLYLRNSPQPVSVEKILQRWEDHSTWSGIMREERPFPPRYSAYLSDAPLNAAQQERAYKLLQTYVTEKHWPNAAYLVPALLKNNSHREEMKKIIIGQLARNIRLGLEQSFKVGPELNQWSTLLHQYFPQDAEAKDALFHYFTSYLEKFDMNGEPALKEVIPLIHDQRVRIKENLIPLLEISKGESPAERAKEIKLIRALLHLDLKDHEFVLVFNRALANPKSAYMVDLVQRHVSKIGPEGAKTLLKAYVNSTAQNQIYVIDMALAAFPDKALLQKQLMEQISEALSLSLGTLPPADMASRFNYSSSLILSNAIPTSSALGEKLLSFLEKNMTEQTKSFYSVMAFFDYLDVSDPAIAHRVMKLIQKNKIDFGKDNPSFYSLLERMPKECSASFGLLVHD